jgi:hypothetical protein
MAQPSTFHLKRERDPSLQNFAIQIKDKNIDNIQNREKRTPWLSVRKRTIPTERLPLVGEGNANFYV